uniref:AlNc14C1G47 protein n=1 Tax=Albugo laibachii Nc14 TaxID=890382 RepID=F0VYP5_9STRA|nr:AlNc14C1G47 [Albugo laibachii Nc14]|eukprot:CCA13909.1 AlNc14C1G47 [Albugo laibachii Nc14]
MNLTRVDSKTDTFSQLNKTESSQSDVHALPSMRLLCMLNRGSVRYSEDTLPTQRDTYITTMQKAHQKLISDSPPPSNRVHSTQSSIHSPEQCCKRKGTRSDPTQNSKRVRFTCTLKYRESQNLCEATHTPSYEV